jgi:hypothetical protein
MKKSQWENPRRHSEAGDGCPGIRPSAVTETAEDLNQTRFVGEFSHRYLHHTDALEESQIGKENRRQEGEERQNR